MTPFIFYENIMFMLASDLKDLLPALGITQAEFARLVGVTTRAVTLWIAGERPVPGPVEAYTRVLQSLPLNLREIEIRRFQKGRNMRDGFYGVTFQSNTGYGMSILVFENGRVYGTDTALVRYDGGYRFDQSSGRVSVQVKVTFPPNVPSVLGIVNPYEWAIDVTAQFDPSQNSGSVEIVTSLGQVLTGQYIFLRDLPQAA